MVFSGVAETKSFVVSVGSVERNVSLSGLVVAIIVIDASGPPDEITLSCGVCDAVLSFVSEEESTSVARTSALMFGNADVSLYVEPTSIRICGESEFRSGSSVVLMSRFVSPVMRRLLLDDSTSAVERPTSAIDV